MSQVAAWHDVESSGCTCDDLGSMTHVNIFVISNYDKSLSDGHSCESTANFVYVSG